MTTRRRQSGRWHRRRRRRRQELQEKCRGVGSGGVCPQQGRHRIYISNEDIKTASVINIAAGKVEHIIPVAQEPEGVATTPDGISSM